MKIKFLFLPLLAISLLGSCRFSDESNDKSNSFHVVTLNIRFDNPKDGINDWEHRRSLVIEYLSQEHPEIFCLQEALINQINDLLAGLPDYEYIGTGRDHGEVGGEHCPLFFDRNRIKLLEQSQFWLSESPDSAGSIGWDAMYPRIVTWGKFQLAGSGRTFFLFNTHLSHVSENARLNSVRLIAEKIARIAGTSEVVLSGDFNTTRGSDAYLQIHRLLSEKNALKNSDSTFIEPGKNTVTTFNGFSGKTPPRVIDYVFVSKSIPVLSYKIGKIERDGIYISDHWPVSVMLDL